MFALSVAVYPAIQYLILLHINFPPSKKILSIIISLILISPRCRMGSATLGPPAITSLSSTMSLNSQLMLLLCMHIISILNCTIFQKDLSLFTVILHLLIEQRLLQNQIINQVLTLLLPLLVLRQQILTHTYQNPTKPLSQILCCISQRDYKVNNDNEGRFPITAALHFHYNIYWLQVFWIFVYLLLLFCLSGQDLSISIYIWCQKRLHYHILLQISIRLSSTSQVSLFP